MSISKWKDEDSTLLCPIEGTFQLTATKDEDRNMLNCSISPSGRYVYYLYNVGMVVLDAFCGTFMDFDDFVQKASARNLHSYIPISDTNGWLLMRQSRSVVRMRERYRLYALSVSMDFNRRRIKVGKKFLPLNRSWVLNIQVQNHMATFLLESDPNARDKQEVCRFQTDQLNAQPELSAEITVAGLSPILIAPHVLDRTFYAFESKNSFMTLGDFCGVFKRLAKNELTEGCMDGKSRLVAESNRTFIELDEDIRCLGIEDELLEMKTFIYKLEHQWREDRLLIMLTIECKPVCTECKPPLICQHTFIPTYRSFFGAFSLDTLSWQRINVNVNLLETSIPLGMFIDENDVMTVVKSELNPTFSISRTFGIYSYDRECSVKRNRETGYVSEAYRIALRRPDTLANLTQFAVNNALPKWKTLEPEDLPRYFPASSGFQLEFLKPWPSNYKVMTRLAMKRKRPAS